MTVPGYLRTFREAVRELEASEIREISEISPNLNSLPSLISHPSAFGRAYAWVLAALERRCPDYVERARWQRAVDDGRAFLAQWGEQAQALGWTARDLFGLHTIPAHPNPSYSRLSRYDATGLIWLLRGQPVVALTENTAAIQNPTTGNVVVYRKHNKPAYGPTGDSLDDFLL